MKLVPKIVIHYLNMRSLFTATGLDFEDDELNDGGMNGDRSMSNGQKTSR